MNFLGSLSSERAMNPRDDYDMDSGRFSTLCLANLPPNITATHLFRFFRSLGYCGALNEYSIKFTKNDPFNKCAVVTFECTAVAREILQLYERRLISVPGCPELEMKPVLRVSSEFCRDEDNAESTRSMALKQPRFSTSDSTQFLKSHDDNVNTLPLDSLRFKDFDSTREPRASVSNHAEFPTDCSIVVRNVAYGMQSAMKNIFTQYGHLRQPDDIIIQGSGSDCYAVVNFYHPSSVKAVLANRDNIYVGFRKLEIDEWRTSSTAYSNFYRSENVLSSASDNSSEASYQTKADAHPKLLLTNLPFNISKAEIFHAFKTFGRIADPPGIFLQRENRTALIPFIDSRCVNNAINTTQGTMVLRNGLAINIFVYEEENSISGESSTSNGRLGRRNRGKRHANFKVSSTPALINDYLQIRNVSGLKSSPSDLLHKYLRNERRSGGGEIDDFAYEPLCERVLVKFREPASFERVLKNKLGHKLEDIPFYVTRLPPVSRKHIYVHQVPENISKSDLQKYFAQIVDSTIVDIKFRFDNSGAMIEFADEGSVDIKKLGKKIDAFPLEDATVELLPVNEPDSVMVRGQISSNDALALSLEDFLISKVTNLIDGSVRYVIERPSEQLYWVIFEDYRCLQFLDDHLTVDKSNVSITKFYDHLGFVSNKDHANFLRTFGSSRHCVELTSLQSDYLKKKDNLEHCKTWPCFNNWVFVLTLSAEKPELHIIGTSEQMSIQIADILKSRLKPFFIPLDAAMLKLINGKTTIFDEEMVRFFGDDYAYEINDESSLVIVSSEMPRMCQIVEGFFDTNVNITEKITVNVLEYRYLKKNQALVNQFTEDVRMNWSETDQCLYATSNLSSLKTLRKNMEQFLRDNGISQLNFNENGIPTYLRSAYGRRDIQSVEENTGAVILDDKSYPIDSDNGFFTRSSLKGCRLIGDFNGLKVLVVCDDMTEQTVDCIVNASNNELQHIGGLAAALLDKAGDTLQSECTAHVKNHGKVKTGDVFASDPGKLNCRKVIHAVGPRYEGGRQKEETLLRQAVVNSMRKANELGMKSIAVPAISTCVFGYPAPLAVPIIIDACLSFDHGSLAEIRFVDLNMQTIHLLVNQLKSLPDFKPVNESKPKSVIVASTPTENISRLAPEIIIAKSDDQSAQNLLFNGCKVEIIKDSITNVAKDFDVIVNTTGSNIFDGGACSKAITDAAGQALVYAVQTQYPSGIGNNDLAVTVAGNLPCKNIYHICCNAWNSQTSPGQLRSKIFACLDEASAASFKSIAFPAIGTGGLKYPSEEVAQLMIDDFKCWLENNDPRPSTIEKIAIVVFPGDQLCVKAFDDEYHSRLRIYSKTVNIGKMVVEIVRSDITQEATDAIVCPTDAKLNLKHGQVCLALSAAAGQNCLENLVSSMQHNKNEKIHILNIEQRTKLKAAHILFVNVTHKESNGDWLSTFDDILTSVNNAFLNNISMPLIGAGNLGLKAEEIVGIMFQAFQKFSMNMTAESSLKTVRILIPNVTNFQSACQYLDSGKFTTIADAKMRLSVLKGIMNKLLPKNQASGTSVPSNEKPLCLTLYGTKIQIEKAESMLIELTEANRSEKVIHSDIVEQLSNSEIDHLQNEARKLKIDLNVRRFDNEIKLRGSNVEKFADLMHDLLRQYSEHINCPANVEWYKKSTKKFDWEPIVSGVGPLEIAYKSRFENSTILNVFESEDDVVVDMRNMVVEDAARSNILFHLKRKESHDIIPVDWDWKEGGDEVSNKPLVQLNVNSSEYQRVRDAVMKTAPETHIIKIERVENPTRYKQYCLARSEVEKVVSINLPSERLLFHGTAPTRVESICAGCFDRSMSGVNGVVFGQGSYFHKDFSYSVQYGKTVFYCNVLTGNYCVGNQSTRTAPEFDPTRKIRFDSTVDNATNPSIFVVYSDNHAYPSYLITCA